ncbi:MAG: peptide chain release factor N(5)-glutamine methyltransferase [Fimbriimonadaceae bacterium]|nr:MAG: peptide chain release factor N(5)-glutamine methyltransferase [Fimbriimonadaceae bacterium]
MTQKPLTLGDWIQSATEQLQRAGVDSARLDAQVLAAHGFGQDRSWVLAHPEAEITSDLDSILARRVNREPLAYIVGSREFYGRRFFVDHDVLVPRQETEFVVERALLWMRDDSLPWSVLDVGTGSGCIGITLALEKPDAQVTLLDKSANALRVASKNADALGARVDFVHSDLFTYLPKSMYRMVVSNPPYVAHSDDLPPEVREFEPADALFAEAQGTAFYRRLAADCYHRTLCDVLIVEIGQGQSDAVESIFGEYGWVLADALADLSGIVRTLTFTPDSAIFK